MITRCWNKEEAIEKAMFARHTKRDGVEKNRTTETKKQIVEIYSNNDPRSLYHWPIDGGVEAERCRTCGESCKMPTSDRPQCALRTQGGEL